MAEPNRYHYDLEAVRRELAKAGKHKPLQTLISRYVAARSVSIDIEQAARRMRMVIELIPPGRQRRLAEANSPFEVDGDLEVILGSVFQMALLIYVTCVTNNDARARVPLEKGANPEVQAAHKRIVALRHTAIGHFGHLADHIDGPWAVDRPILRVVESNPTLVLEWRRTYLKQNIWTDLALCINHAEISGEKIWRERGNELLDALVSPPKDVAALILRHRIEWSEESSASFAALAKPRPQEN